MFATILSLMACRGDGPAFVPISELCAQRAEALCSGLVRCCGAAPDVEECERSERAACDAERALLDNEAGLGYDARRAFRMVDAQRDHAASCGTVLPLAAFYTGGLELGADCERSAQCASGACDDADHVCSAASSELSARCVQP